MTPATGARELYTWIRDGYYLSALERLEDPAPIEGLVECEVNNSTLLHAAASQMGIPARIITLLVARGIDPNVRMQGGILNYLPLHTACANKSASAVLALIEVGADPHAKDSSERNGLHLVAQLGGTKIATILLDHGVDLHARDQQGITPLHSAVLWRQPGLATFLVSRGADANALDPRGKSPLDLAELDAHLHSQLLAAVAERSMSDAARAALGTSRRAIGL